MRISKKSSSKKPIVIFIYGPMAVGKLTVSKILHKRLGFRLTHNHAINDVVQDLFKHGSSESGNAKLHFRNYLMEEAVKAKISYITTYCYNHDFVYPNGLKEEDFVQNLKKKLEKLGAKFLPIHLKASPEELLKRVSASSRRAFRKLKSKKIMREHLRDLDFSTSPKLKNNLIIDNSNISPSKVADMIIKHFK